MFAELEEVRFLYKFLALVGKCGLAESETYLGPADRPFRQPHRRRQARAVFRLRRDFGNAAGC